MIARCQLGRHPSRRTRRLLLRLEGSDLAKIVEGSLGMWECVGYTGRYALLHLSGYCRYTYVVDDNAVWGVYCSSAMAMHGAQEVQNGGRLNTTTVSISSSGGVGCCSESRVCVCSGYEGI